VRGEGSTEQHRFAVALWALERVLANWGSTLRSTVLAASALFFLPACAAVSQLFSSDNDDASFVQVDELVGRVERVHIDCELAGQNVSEGLETLMAMVGPQFRGDPTLAYDDLAAAIKLSQKQEQTLREDFGPMQETAGKVFEQWTADLDAFTSDVMRQHSAERMTAARERYDDIVAAVEPALASYAAFNASLADQALYLGHDFNAESVALIESELRALGQTASALTARFDECTKTCQNYVRKSALRGQISPRSRKGV